MSAGRDRHEQDYATGRANDDIKSEVRICAIYSSAVRQSRVWLHEAGWGDGVR